MPQETCLACESGKYLKDNKCHDGTIEKCGEYFDSL